MTMPSFIVLSCIGLMLCAQPLMVDSPALAFQNPDGQPDKMRIHPACRRIARHCMSRTCTIRRRPQNRQATTQQIKDATL
jgi:hypothetical protein